MPVCNSVSYGKPNYTRFFETVILSVIYCYQDNTTQCLDSIATVRSSEIQYALSTMLSKLSTILSKLSTIPYYLLILLSFLSTPQITIKLNVASS